jgi:hypothetical protein
VGDLLRNVLRSANHALCEKNESVLTPIDGRVVVLEIAA